MSATLQTYLNRTAAPAAVQDAFNALLKEANHADDLAHDMGVFAFCGLNFDKDDQEGIRSEEGSALLEVLSRCRDERTMDKYNLRELEAAAASFRLTLEYVHRTAAESHAAESADLRGLLAEYVEELSNLQSNQAAGSFLLEQRATLFTFIAGIAALPAGGLGPGDVIKLRNEARQLTGWDEAEGGDAWQ